MHRAVAVAVRPATQKKKTSFSRSYRIHVHPNMRSERCLHGRGLRPLPECWRPSWRLPCVMQGPTFAFLHLLLRSESRVQTPWPCLSFAFSFFFFPSAVLLPSRMAGVSKAGGDCRGFPIYSGTRPPGGQRGRGEMWRRAGQSDSGFYHFHICNLLPLNNAMLSHLAAD